VFGIDSKKKKFDIDPKKKVFWQKLLKQEQFSL
jgi:hypothetical protein